MSSVRKAVIPAAGLGTRFLPASKAVPKEMLPIVDTPTIQLVVEEAVSAGVRDVVVVNGRHKGAIEEHFDHAYELESTLRERRKYEELKVVQRVVELANIVSVRQKRPLGLGHAVLSARHAIGDEPFAILLGDDLMDTGEHDAATAQLIKVYEETGCGAVAVVEVPEGHEQRYGIVDGKADERGLIKVERMVEKPAPGKAPSRMAIFGRYVVPPAIWELLARTSPGALGEIQLTDALAKLAREGQLIAVPVKGIRHDAGNRIGYLRANLAYALKREDLRDEVLALCREMLEHHDR